MWNREYRKMALIYKLKHYKVKTPFCDKCGKMISNENAKRNFNGKCWHCDEKL